ncbi:syntaxin 6, N-terminal-domain-containing protein [Filobasidium floriforme]|uniref:syntaxin 6, N-terminal-domain-containing protein n=1 Tax=Filobasidium floriforme TaxID=5210 RepID=UPI001E8CF189|nr:syntaxin 6, N-terminal-domain-containing protein [Filobasidium floriforme]KAH8079656.1 syntaxin 6, N-terminal-domain-containing protein [Filobasidium floriforme]
MDPYHDVKKEVESNLEQVRNLAASYRRLQQRISGMSTTGQRNILLEAHQDLEKQLHSLLTDVEDLEASVLAVEQAGDRWSIAEHEVKARRRFLETVKAEVQAIQGDSSTDESQPNDPLQASPSNGGYSRFEDIELGGSPNKLRGYSDVADERRRTSDEVGQYEMEQQQMMIRQQDSTIGVISGTIATLAGQAGLIGREVLEQNEMLDDLSLRIDATDSKLTAANKRLKAFIRANEETKSTYCIFILIIILVILLLLVILT